MKRLFSRRTGPQPRNRAGHPRAWAGLAALWLLSLLGSAAHGQALPVTSSLRLHLKADVGVTTTAGNKVSAWNDQSGLNNHAIQATSGAQPVLVAASTINGRPALRFDGAADGTVDRLDNTTATLSANGSANTVFVVGRVVAASDGGVAFTSRLTNPIMSYQLGYGSGAFYVYSDGVNAGNNATIPDQRTTIRAPFISSFRSAGPGTVLGLRLNGTAQTVSQPAGMAAESGVAGFVVGTRQDIPAVAPWNGDYAELIVYNRALTAAEITQVETYLSNKYNIATPANPIPVSSVPVPVTSGLYRHFEADAGVTSDASGNVSGWADQSGNAADVAQAVPANQPLLVASGIGGRPTLRFNGTSHVLSSSATADLTAGLSIFTVDRVAVSKSTQNGLLRIGVLNAGGSQLELYHNSGSVSTYSGADIIVARRASNGSLTGSGYRVGADVPPAIGQPIILSNIVTAGSAFTLATNGGNTAYATTGANLLPAAADVLHLGMRGTAIANTGLNGDLSEVLIYNRAVTPAEQAQIEAYLANKYSITLTSPSISSFSPTSGAAGTSVTLTGTNLSSLTGVSFNGTAASVFSTGTGTTATATVPAGATTGPITATSAQGSGSSTGNFSIAAVPTISSFTPGTGTAGTTVTVTGTALDLVTSVQIGGATATSVAVVGGSGNTQLTAVAGSGVHTGRVVLNYSSGQAISTTDFVVPQPDITRVEYFIDTDPGFGSGISVPLTAGPDISGAAVAVSLSSLGTGFHLLGVRSQDATGTWSLTSRRSFYYEPNATTAAPNVTKLEYFLDTDPGFGNGVDVPVTAATDVSGVAVAVPLGSVSTGFHNLSIRSKDANGKWSLTAVRSFYYEPNATVAAPNVVKLEYFLDADPGFGSGVDVPVTAATDISGVALAVPLGSVSPGFHSLQVRSQDANGKWSLTSVRTFYYEPVLAAAPNINKLEYYFDNDPGFGSATDVPVTPAADLPGFGFAADASALADGAHRLFIRSRDANGKWSLVWNKSFVKNGCASSANFAAGLPASSYVSGGSVGNTPDLAFNTDPAAPNTGNSPYIYNGGVIQADLGTAQTVSELRYKLTPSASSSFTILVQTAATTAGPFTTIDTYAASLTAGTTTPVTRTLASPATARVFRLAVQNAAGQYVVLSGAGAYNFNCAGPSIISFTPAGGAGGTSVVITGTNFSGATALTFNGVAAASFAVNSGTQITAVAPNGGSTGQICVTTPGGTACSSTNFNYPPVLAMSQFGFNGCAGTGLNIGFTATGSFNSGNTITAQLSDASGSFAAPTAIGSVAFTGQGSGNVVATIPTSTPTGTGYRIRLVGDNPAVTSTTDNGSNLSITTQPTATPSSNSPVAYNGTIQLNAATVAGATYFWTGPGFSSNQQNPTIPNATVGNSGSYTLYVTVGGCQSPGVATAVTVNPSALPILSMAQFGGSACAGTQLNVGFSVTGNSFAAGNTITAQLSDASGSFAALVSIGSVLFSGQGSGSVTVTFPAGTAQGSGYRLRLTGDNPAVTSTTDNGSNLTINTLPAAVASSNSPVTFGATIQLNAQTVAGATYFWTGPSFSSNQQNPTITNAASGNAGTYTLYVTVGSCTSQTTTTVTVGTAPAVVLATGPVSGTFCPGAGLSVPYSISSGSVNAGNVFSVQLSDASGSFGSPVSIGSVSSTAGSGSIAATIPVGTTAGSGYRVRVLASNPATTGTDNGSNLTVGPLTFAWTGAVSTDWFNGANWSCGQVPTASSVVVIGSGASLYPIITGSTAALALNLTVQSGATFTNNGLFNLYGSVTVNGTVNASLTSSWYFAGSGVQYIYGSNPLQVGNVYINSGSTLTMNNVLNVSASWYNYGSFVGGVGYNVYFNGAGGTQYIGGTSSTTFYSVYVNSGAVVNLGINTVFLNNFVVNGTFGAASYGVVFGGSTGQTIGGSGTSVYYNVTITNTVGVTLVSNITVLGDWINNGLFVGGTYSVIFAGTVAQIIGGTQVTNFYNVTFNNPVSVTLTQNIYVLGGFVNSGIFYGYQTVGGVTTGCYVRFAGGAAQVITANATTYFYHFYVDNTAGVSLSTNIYIAGNYYLYSGSFNPGTFTVYFNGFEGSTVVQTVGGYTALSFYGWNIGSGSYVRLIQNVTWLGSFANFGTFYGYNLVGGVYTGYTAIFGGSGAQVISGTGVYEFWHVTWSNLLGITLQQNISVWGNWLNNGGYFANGYLVSFIGNVAQLIGGSVNTTFHHITITNLVSVSLNQPIVVLGNWGGTGVFLGNGYLTYFNGTAAQTIFCGLNTRFFDLRFNNATSVTLLSNLYLNGNWTNDGGFVANGFGVFFSGSALQVIAGSVTSQFYHLTILPAAQVQLG
ncbi:MAG: IPT/TIG domain-containing protein, partial [Bacteroidota bacterium]|nr:IPT/TIG domain-containing protein [Bacteroidota bacterium]